MDLVRKSYVVRVGENKQKVENYPRQQAQASRQVENVDQHSKYISRVPGRSGLLDIKLGITK